MEFERAVKTGYNKIQEITHVVRHLSAERSGQVDNDVGFFPGIFFLFKVYFLKDVKNCPEINPPYDPDMAGPLRINQYPVVAGLPKTGVLGFHDYFPLLGIKGYMSLIPHDAPIHNCE
jgi:hypothetical protein